MTSYEFNNKWKHRLEKNHYGIALNSPEILKLVDETFTRWEQEYPDFTYSQIKYKFGTSAVYCDNVPYDETDKLEKQINNLL